MIGTTVFVSYGREDINAAQKLHQELIAAGHRPWIDTVDLIPGQTWRSAIDSAIKDSRFFLALISSRTVNRSGFVHKEMIEAFEVLDTFPENEIYLIPARLDSCKPAHRRLNDLNWVDLFPDWTAGFQRILSALQSTESPEDKSERILSALIKGWAQRFNEDPSSTNRNKTITEAANVLEQLRIKYRMDQRLFLFFVEMCLRKERLISLVDALTMMRDPDIIDRLKQDNDLGNEAMAWVLQWA